MLLEQKENLYDWKLGTPIVTHTIMTSRFNCWTDLEELSHTDNSWKGTFYMYETTTSFYLEQQTIT